MCIGVIRDPFAVLLTVALDAKAEFFENADRCGILYIGHGGTLAKLILDHAVGQHGARHLGAKALPPKRLGQAIPKIDVPISEAKSRP